MTSLSTHVLDLELGRPAPGLTVALFSGQTPLAQAQTNADGRIPLLADALASGTYRLVFDIAGYWRRHGRTAPFLQQVSIDFALDAASSHYHVPLLLSPYACTTYRGS